MYASDKRFDMKEHVYFDFEFGGINIRKTSYGYIAEQSSYAEKLEELPSDASFHDFGTLRHKCAWLSLTRPDILAIADILSQVTNEFFNKKHLKHINKTVRKIQLTKQRGLRYHRLDLNSLRIIAMRDASFTNNKDLSSQLGNIIVLTDSSQYGNTLSFSSYKSKRIVRSVLGAETYSFADCFDSAYTLKDELYRVFRKTVTIAMLTDSGCLFDVVVKSTRTSEKRLMIDIATARDAYEKFEIDDIGWISGATNMADALAK